MRTLAAVAVVVVALSLTGQAAAHMLRHEHKLTKMTPRQEYLYGVGSISHAQHAITRYRLVMRWFQARRSFTIHSRNPYTSFVAQSAYAHARVMVRDHRWLLKEGEAFRQEGWKRLHPIPAIPHKSGWLCIHRYEGSWTDSDDPYWGGLQMNRGFMETYGSDMIARFHGYANVWPVWAQMVVAERAYASGRGYGPWPNTARSCGLL